MPPGEPASALVTPSYALVGAPARQLELLTAIARRTGNAVIVTDPTGRIEWVNEGFTRLTGLLPDEVRGRRPGDLLQGPDTDRATRAEMAAAIALGVSFDVVVLNYAKSGRQYWVRIEAEPTRDETGALTGYVALETDVTAQRIAEARDGVLKRIGDRLLTCDAIERAAELVVDELSRTLDLRAVQVWRVVPGQPHLHYVAGACADNSGQEWLDVSANRTFARGTDWVVGVGAPGVAWGTAAPCIKTDFWEYDSRGQLSRRAAAAKLAGIRTVCAVPVLGPEGVIAVVEIGGSHNYPGHEQLPALVERVARQLGAFIVQLQSRRAFEALFRQSPDALLVVDSEGLVQRANARSVALFGDAVGRKLAELLAGGEALLDVEAPAFGDAVPLQQLTGTHANATRFSAEVAVSSTTATGAPSNIVSVRDLTERHEAEEALRRSLAEKVTLVQEVHHRVKNNLQIISSLVSLQAADLESEAARTALRDTSNRIQSMALVHQQLYANDNLARIVFGDYTRALCTALHVSLAPDAALTVDADFVETTVERAVPAGLILNELLTNAFKYGHAPGQPASVRVRVEKTDDGFAFVVSDTGPAFGDAPARKGSIGQTLIHALVRQLRAKRTQSRSETGNELRIAIPNPLG